MDLRCLAALLLLSAGAFAWMDPAWQYRVPIAVSNNGSALTDYQVAVNTTSLVYNNTGLAASWHFSESGGTRFVDSSGNGNDGTYNGETLNNGTLTNFNFNAGSGWVDGKYGRALQFDGVNDYVGAAKTSSSGDVTVAAWIYPGSYNAAPTHNPRILYNYDGAGDLQIILREDGYFKWGTASGGAGVGAAVLPPLDSWTYVAVTRSGSTYKVYYNGAEQSTVSVAPGNPVPTTQALRLGADIEGTGSNGHFNGTMDDLRIYSRALSASEIAQLYQNNTFMRSGLAGYWRLDEGAGTTAYDSHILATPDNRNGTKSGNALSLDGANDYAAAGDSASLSLGANDFTVVAWFKTATTGVYQTILNKGYINFGGCWQDDGYVVWIANDNRLWAKIEAGSTYYSDYLYSAGTVTDDKWHQAVLTRRTSDGRLYLYLDGRLEARNVTVPPGVGVNNPRSLEIGRGHSPCSPFSPTYFFNGTIDEVRLYNRTLRASEIESLYNESRLRLDYADLRFSQAYAVYETPISISGAGTDLTDYQVLVNVTNPAILSHVKADGSDLRFFGAQTSAPYSQAGLPYWIESINASAAKIWVKANVSAGGTAIYMYYGNPSAGPAGNYFNTFDVLGDGSGGALTVSSANTIVNTYAYLTGNESAGDSTIAINNGTGFSNGDEIVIIQMQNYSGGTAGAYEFRRISSGGGTASLTLNAPLKNSYASGTFDSAAATVAQIVRVPQYTTVTVNSGSSITAAAWNGYSGGVVVFRASGTVSVAGSINVSGKGFRGGIRDGADNDGYPGESHTGKPTSRSTLSNLGGGGGVNKQSGYGGDGGGGGGYGTAGQDGGSSPNLNPPGNPGQGGAMYGAADLSTMFLGSGGGAAYCQDSEGNGSGIIAVYSNTLDNNGRITANGANAILTACEGGGGGGAGGSIYLVSNALNANNNVTAIGGSGDKTSYDSYDGSGGDGGSGRIRLSANSISGNSSPSAYATGFDTEHNRKYASPEPSAAVGSETVKSQGNEAPLNYWQESDSRVWVKVAGIPAGQSTVYAYYGNPNATGAGNYFNTLNVLGSGADGTLTASSAGTVINAYAYLTGNKNAGDTVIAVNSGAGFSNGDEVLIVQMQNNSGGIAGTYEFRRIASGGGTAALTLDSPLKNSYVSGTFDSTTAAVTQVVRVPQYTDVVINPGASITAPAWDGYKGGIVVFRANGTVANYGDINVTAKGFRGGVGGTWVSWPGNAIGNQGESYRGKGISVVNGTAPSIYRSANLGGGGGGQQTSSPRNDRAGGGGGGYGTAGGNGTVQYPPSGTGNVYMGSGGAPYGSSSLSTVFFGSGGGGGSNGAPTGSGGNGGGIVMIFSSSITGSIAAKGGNWVSGGEGQGGGAGGSILILSSSISSLTANASYGIGQPVSCCGESGGNGGYGIIRLMANSISGTSSPSAYTTGFDTEHNRKYASPEPTLSLQQEELQSPALFVGISPSSKTTYPAYNETFSFWVYNNQTFSDGFSLSCAGTCAYSENPVTATPYQNKSVTVTMTSANVSGTTTYAITVTSQSNASNSASVSVSLAVDTTRWRSNWTDAYGREFKYRIPITVTNGGSALADYQVNITADTSAPIGLGRMRGDCGDLRVTNGTNEMPYWIESGCNTTNTKIWARVPYVPAGSSTVYAYYGNPSATTASNGPATFDLFDDFLGSSLNTTAWSKTGSTVSVGGGVLTVVGTDAWNANGIASIKTFDRASIGYVAEFRAKVSNLAGVGGVDLLLGYGSSPLSYADHFGFWFHTNGNAYAVKDSLTPPYVFGETNAFAADTWYTVRVYAKKLNDYSVEFSGAIYNDTSTKNGKSVTIQEYQNTETSSIDYALVRKYASPEPSALPGAEQSKGYRTLVRRCGMKQENATVTAYQGLNVSGSCLSDQYGICSLEIGAGTYDLQLTFADNSTAWKNATAFG